MPYNRALDLLLIAAVQSKKGLHEAAAKTFADATVSPSLTAAARLIASYNAKQIGAVKAAKKPSVKASAKSWPFNVSANLMPEDDGTVNQELRVDPEENNGLREHQTAGIDDLGDMGLGGEDEEFELSAADSEEDEADEDEPNSEDAATDESGEEKMDVPTSEEEKAVALAAVKRLRAARATAGQVKTVAGAPADAGAAKFSRALRNVLASHVEAAKAKKKKPAPKRK